MRKLSVITGLLLLIIFNSYSGVLLNEDWESGGIDGEIWVPHSGNGIVEVIENPPGNHVLKMEDCPIDLSTYIYTVNSFPRGDNLSCTFKWWYEVHPEDLEEYSNAPALTTIYGPWHFGDSSGPIFNIEAGIAGYFGGGPFYANDFRIIENGGLNGTAIDTESIELISSASGEENAVWFRVWLGDLTGMKIELSDNGTDFVVMKVLYSEVSFDTIGLEANSFSPCDTTVSNNQNNWLGFGQTSWNPTFTDDIIVENDSAVVEDWELH